VVRFTDDNGEWVGNFQRGGIGFDIALEHPDGRSVLLIAGGQGYVVDPHAKKVTSMFSGAVTAAVHTGGDRVVFSTFTEFVGYGATGFQWRTRRLSWDGFRSFRVEGGILQGEAWTPIGDKWAEFSVDLSTGEATGGAYP
jgi:hypothetical protein